MNENVQSMTLREPPAVPPAPIPTAQAAAGQAKSFCGWLANPVTAHFPRAQALGALAYWGHQTGWTIPGFASLTGKDAKAEDDWCDEHVVPESQCVECKPGLMPKPGTFGWCETHGVHDCPLEHPEVAQLNTTPQVTQADLQRAKRALELVERQQNDPQCKLHPRRIQLSAEAIDKTGIELGVVHKALKVESVAANGEITYDPTRLSRLSARSAGSVWWVGKKIGDKVEAGEIVALVEAGEVGRAKTELLLALDQVEVAGDLLARLKPLKGNAVSGAEVRKAEAELRQAQNRLVRAQQTLVNFDLPVRVEAFKPLGKKEREQRLQFLGLEALAQTFGPEVTTNNLLPVRARFKGEVIDRQAVEKDVVDTGKVLLTVADVSHMWLNLKVRPEDVRLLARGQTVRFLPNAGKEEATGKLFWISTEVDDKTRTVKVCVLLENPGRQLRANMFGSGQVILRQEPQALVIPNEAVHWEGKCTVVFVWDRHSSARDAPKVFHVRSVRLGVRDAETTEVIAGLLPGELVATRNSGIVRAELLKSNLGEG